MNYEKELFDEVIYVAAGKLSPNDSADLLEWVESLEVTKSKVDEYEAKAKAFDETIEILKEIREFSKQTKPHSQRMKVKRRNYVQFCDEVLREIELSYKEIIDEYESGESNE